MSYSRHIHRCTFVIGHSDTNILINIWLHYTQKILAPCFILISLHCSHLHYTTLSRFLHYTTLSYTIPISKTLKKFTVANFSWTTANGIQTWTTANDLQVFTHHSAGTTANDGRASRSGRLAASVALTPRTPY